MDNKEAAQLLVQLYADYCEKLGVDDGYVEAVATAIMALGRDEDLHPATTTAPGSWFPNEITVQNTAKWSEDGDEG